MASFTSDDLDALGLASREAMARLKPTGEVLDAGGVTLVFGDLAWTLMNGAFLTSPVDDEADALRRLEVSRAYFQRRGCAWTLTLRDEWLTEPMRSALARSGLKVGLRTHGMAAERLVSPARPPPPELEIRPAEGEAGRYALVEVNVLCYGLPTAWARELGGFERLFPPGDFAHVGYVGNKPVSVSATLRMGDVLYVAWVATLPSFRRRGYAEAVMRHSYEAARAAHGLTRTALHATDTARSLYEAMGYRRVTGFSVFVPS